MPCWHPWSKPYMPLRCCVPWTWGSWCWDRWCSRPTCRGCTSARSSHNPLCIEWRLFIRLLLYLQASPSCPYSSEWWSCSFARPWGSSSAQADNPAQVEPWERIIALHIYCLGGLKTLTLIAWGLSRQRISWRSRFPRDRSCGRWLSWRWWMRCRESR